MGDVKCIFAGLMCFRFVLVISSCVEISMLNDLTIEFSYSRVAPRNIGCVEKAFYMYTVEKQLRLKGPDIRPTPRIL